jgi:hypothetical protein
MENDGKLPERVERKIELRKKTENRELEDGGERDVRI